MDSHSRKILKLLQQDSRLTVQQLAESVGLSSTPCWNRVKEMESQGIIKGYAVQVDRLKVGLNLMVMVEVNLTQHAEKNVSAFEAMIQASAQVVQCYATAGACDYLLTVMTPDMEQYETFLQRVLLTTPAVAHVRSTMVLREVKQSMGLPL